MSDWDSYWTSLACLGSSVVQAAQDASLELVREWTQNSSGAMAGKAEGGEAEQSKTAVKP